MINSKYTVYDITERGLFCDGDWIEKKDQDKNGNIRLIQLADIGDGYFHINQINISTKILLNV